MFAITLKSALVAGALCGCVNSGSSAKESPIPNESYPFVSLMETDADGNVALTSIALDDCALKIGEGPAERLSIKETRCNGTELARGRELFDSALIMAYRADGLGLPQDDTSLGGGNGAHAPSEAESGTAGVGAVDVPNGGSQPGTLALNIEPPREHGFELRFGSTVSSQTTEMLAYFRTLHENYR